MKSLFGATIFRVSMRYVCTSGPKKWIVRSKCSKSVDLVVHEEGRLLGLALDLTRECSELPPSAGEWVDRFAAADEYGRTDIKAECLAM